MTFLEASIKILKETGNKPLSSREIWDKISEQKLIKSKSKTPWVSLNTILLQHSKKDYNKTIHFDIVSNNPMKFILKDLNEKSETIDNNSEKKELYSITSANIGWRRLTVYNNDGIIEYELSDCSEYTYIIEDVSKSTIKIGQAKNDPTIRFRQLKINNPYIKILHIFPLYQWSKNDLYNKFKSLNKDLEWTSYTLELRNFFQCEIAKHSKVMGSFNLKNRLNDLEKKMLEII